MTTPPPSPVHPPSTTPPRVQGSRFLTIRAVLLGLVGVLVICCVTPFNNLVVNNTDFIGNHYPSSVLLLVLVAVLLNAPLARYVPRLALRRDEMIVMLSMWLVASALPYVGLNRYFPGHLSAFWVHSAQTPEYADLMSKLDLPDWLFPTVETKDPIQRGLADVNAGYFKRLPADRSTFMGRVEAVPWKRWVTPTVTWGVFLMALLGMGLFVTLLWHRQWTDVERLPFPLASVYLSLIDTPPPGRWISGELRSARLWVAAAAVFLVHFYNGATVYLYGPPPTAPQIPLYFNFDLILSETPLRFAEWMLRQQKVFFTVIGLMFFVRSNIAFSIWFFYILGNVARIYVGAQSGDTITGGMVADQILGAATMFSVWILIVSRHHLLRVARTVVRGVRDPEERLERVWGIGLLVCIATMIVWLTLAGASPIGAVSLTVALVAMYLVIARVIAETGLLYILVPIEFHRPWLYVVPTDAGTGGVRTTLPSFFFSSMFSGMLSHDTRQAIPGYASTTSKLAEALGDEHRRPAYGQRLGLVALLLGTILVAYLAAGASTLYVRYNYDTTLDRAARMLDEGDNRGSFGDARYWALDSTLQYAPPKAGVIENHSRTYHFGIGLVTTAVLGALRFRIAAWPLDPIGYLLCWTWGAGQIWFSVFIGWAAKQLTLWLAGGGGMQRVRPVFVGLIIGETLGLLLWLVFGFIRAVMGLEYYAVQILPN